MCILCTVITKSPYCININCVHQSARQPSPADYSTTVTALGRGRKSWQVTLWTCTKNTQIRSGKPVHCETIFVTPLLCCMVDLSTTFDQHLQRPGNPKNSGAPRDMPPVVRHISDTFSPPEASRATMGCETYHGASILPNDPPLPRCKGVPFPSQAPNRGGHLRVVRSGQTRPYPDRRNIPSATTLEYEHDAW